MSETAFNDDGGRQPDVGNRPAARRAWTPEVDSETGALLRRLTLTPWLVAGRDDTAIAGVRRNESALRDAFGRLGWVLVVENDLVRLRKSPPGRPEQWAAQGPPPLVCSWFFLLVAAGDAMAPRVGLGALVAAARIAAAEAGLPSTGEIGERRAIAAALRLLDERGLIETLDGDLDDYVRDEDTPVLVAVHHTRLAHVIANPGTVNPAVDQAQWLDHIRREPDPARRMRRRLIDDTCVHATDLDEGEAHWLSQRVRGDDGAPLALAFGLKLERRAEGAAFVLPDEAFRHPRELGPLAFPVPGTVAHAALLLCDHAAAHGHTDTAPGPGWRRLAHAQVLAAIAGFAAQHGAGRGGWRRELADDPAQLAERVSELLGG